MTIKYSHFFITLANFWRIFNFLQWSFCHNQSLMGIELSRILVRAIHLTTLFIHMNFVHENMHVSTIIKLMHLIHDDLIIYLIYCWDVTQYFSWHIIYGSQQSWMWIKIALNSAQWDTFIGFESIISISTVPTVRVILYD